jgi:putative NADH-flavin reductase
VRLSLFGATGALGRECLAQSLEARHELTVLVRTPPKLPAEVRDRIDIVEGDGLAADAVGRAIPMLGMLHDDAWLHKAPIVQY